MSTARHLATIELLHARSFPAQYGRTGRVVSAPGYHLAELTAGGPSGACADREETDAQYEAECDALAEVLARRWGPPQTFGLWSTFVRAQEHREEIPEPWSGLSARVGSVHLWRARDRWVAVGVARWGADAEPGLVAVVTETDPP
jgi:hypothetical protein